MAIPAVYGLSRNSACRDREGTKNPKSTDNTKKQPLVYFVIVRFRVFYVAFVFGRPPV